MELDRASRLAGETSLHAKSVRLSASNPVGGKQDMEHGESFYIFTFTDKILTRNSVAIGGSDVRPSF
jgi:hypothetical protein